MAELQLLQNLSNSLADAAAAAGNTVVRVDDGTRFTASGIAWAQDGLVVATSHGVESDDGLAVILGDGRRLEAKLAGRDDGSDVALLKVSEKLAAPKFASKARAGEIVLAAGRPGDRGLQVSLGVISSIQDRGAGDLYYTDANLAPGFSGGALVNVAGELIGMANLWSRRRSGVILGIQLVQESVDAILGGDEVKRGYLGLRMQAVELSAGSPQSAGLLISGVENESAAEQAGVIIGDVLLEIDGKTLDDTENLSMVLRTSRAGQKVKLRLLRAGTVTELDAVLQAHP